MRAEQLGSRNWKSILSTILFLLLMLFLGIYIWQNREEMLRMLQLSPSIVAGMLACALGSALLNCWYHLIILRVFRLPLTLTDWMGVVSVSNAIAYVLPLRADLVFSAAYYKRVKGLAYTKSISMAAGNIVFGVAFSLLQILLALVGIGFMQGEWPAEFWLVWALCAAFLVVFVVLSLVFQNRIPKCFSRYQAICNVMGGFTALLTNYSMLWRLLVCLCANHLCNLGFSVIAFRAIGLSISFNQAMLFSSISWLSGIVAIVPGNVGIKESVLGASAFLMGALFQGGVAVSLLQRAAMLVIHLMMGLTFALPVYQRLTKSNQESEPASNVHTLSE